MIQLSSLSNLHRNSNALFYMLLLFSLTIHHLLCIINYIIPNEAKKPLYKTNQTNVINQGLNQSSILTLVIEHGHTSSLPNSSLRLPFSTTRFSRDSHVTRDDLTKAGFSLATEKTSANGHVTSKYSRVSRLYSSISRLYSWIAIHDARSHCEPHSTGRSRSKIRTWHGRRAGRTECKALLSLSVGAFSRCGSETRRYAWNWRPAAQPRPGWSMPNRIATAMRSKRGRCFASRTPAHSLTWITRAHPCILFILFEELLLRCDLVPGRQALDDLVPSPQLNS